MLFSTVDELTKYLRSASKPVEFKNFIDPPPWRTLELDCIFCGSSYREEFFSLLRANYLNKYVIIRPAFQFDSDANPAYKLNNNNLSISYSLGNEEIIERIFRYLNGRAFIIDKCTMHVRFDLRGINEDLIKVYKTKLSYCLPFPISVDIAMDEIIDVSGYNKTLSGLELIKFIKLCELLMAARVG